MPTKVGIQVFVMIVLNSYDFKSPGRMKQCDNSFRFSNRRMRIDFDPAKSAKNALERNIPFDLAAKFDWPGAIFAEDLRNHYPERRFIAVGYLDARLHVICFTPIVEGIRIISMRKANAREAKAYEKAITNVRP
jgi:uncharacterized protein